VALLGVTFMVLARSPDFNLCGAGRRARCSSSERRTRPVVARFPGGFMIGRGVWLAIDAGAVKSPAVHCYF